MPGNFVTRPTLASATVLASAVVIVYHNALSAYFFDDDFQWLVSSWAFRPSQLVAFGSLDHFYRPVLDVYFAVATPLFGGSPFLFHLASLALHAANAMVVFAVARAVSWPEDGRGTPDVRFAFLTALLFAVQPADIDAVAWVGAIAEALGVCLGGLSLLLFLEWRRRGRPRSRVGSVVAYVLALLTHESSVVFLPVLAAADWARRGKPSGRVYAPYLAATAAYLAIDVWINSRNYVVSEGHYALGVHLVRNALDYLTALYVGRHDLLNDAFIVVGIALLLARGTRRVRFATLWMLLALAPFLPFTWGNTSRYGYQSAIGFSMLLAAGLCGIDRALRRRLPHRASALVGAALAAAVAVRFAVFATSNVERFARDTQTYRAYLRDFRATHGDVASGSTITLTGRLETLPPHRFLNAAVQWEYGDPTIQIAPYDTSP